MNKSYFWLGVKRCLPDINECEAKENPCEGQPGKRCVNTKGGYICCDAGIDDERCIKGHFCFINSAKRLFLAFFFTYPVGLGYSRSLISGIYDPSRDYEWYHKKFSDQGAFCAGGCGLNAVCMNKTCQCLEGFVGNANTRCIGKDGDLGHRFISVE